MLNMNNSNSGNTFNFVKDINLQFLLNKINELLEKGENVKMKSKDKFKFTLQDTKKLLQENQNYLNTMKNDMNYSKIMMELSQTILDIESKLNKLSLIKFCRDKAEKYLSQVTEKLYNINLVIISLVGKKSSNNDNENNNNSPLLGEIVKLNNKIKEMETNMKIESKRREPEKIIVIEKEKENQPEKCKSNPFKNSQTILMEGISAYLGLETRVDMKQAYEKLIEASSLNNTSAKIILARMYEKGEYVDKSYLKAFNYFREASELGNSIGSYMIANYAENELYDEISEYGDFNETAFEFYNKSAEQGNSDANTKLGIIFENGLLDQKIDYKKAIEYYKQSIELDENPEALNCIGSIYYKGLFLKQNYSLAVESFQRASKLGNIDAANNLGLCYEYGKGVEKNLEKAMIYYKQASEKLHPLAICNQAILLIKLNTNQNKKDYKESFRLLTLSVHLDKNNKDAFYHIGFLYENGFGLISNPYLAFVNYKKALKLGHVKAKTKVGVALFNGLEDYVEKDEDYAIKLLSEAADADEPEALNYLGLVYEKESQFTEKNMEKCIDCLKRAQNLGYENAGINLALINENNNKEYIEKLSKKGNEYAKSILGALKNTKNEDNDIGSYFNENSISKHTENIDNIEQTEQIDYAEFLNI